MTGVVSLWHNRQARSRATSLRSLELLASFLAYFPLPSRHHGTRKLKQALCYPCGTLRYVWPAYGVFGWFQDVRSSFLISVYDTHDETRKEQAPHPGARTPFDCCALTFQPFNHPVCARNEDGTGNVFDLVSIIPWLK